MPVKEAKRRLERSSDRLRDEWVHRMVDLVAVENGLANSVNKHVRRAYADTGKYFASKDRDTSQWDGMAVGRDVGAIFTSALDQAKAQLAERTPMLAKRWFAQQGRVLFGSMTLRQIIGLNDHIKAVRYRLGIEPVRRVVKEARPKVVSSARLSAVAITNELFTDIADEEMAEYVQTPSAVHFQRRIDAAIELNATKAIQALEESISQGEGMNATIARLNSSIGGIESRMDEITRTHVQTVSADTGELLTQYSAPQLAMMQYIAIIDARTCLKCAYNARPPALYPVDPRRRPMIPVHPFCFPAGVLTAGPRPIAASRRWYQGDLVVIHRSAGDPIPVTRNHEILTRRGWVPSQSLVCGDELIDGPLAECVADELMAAVCPDYEQVPTRIENAAGACGFSRLRVPVSTPEFNCKTAHSEIDVHITDGLFTDEGNPPVEQHPGEQMLVLAGLSTHVPLDAHRSRHPLHARLRSTTNGLMRSMGKPIAFGRCHVFHPNAHCTGSVSDSNTLLQQGIPNYGTTHAVSLGNGLYRFPGHVRGSHVVKVQFVKSWCGHVYNLQTATQWYTANGAIVHNCRCSWLPIPKGKLPPKTIDYDAWIRTQTPEKQLEILGRTRFNLLNGGVRAERFVNLRRRELKVSELPDQDAIPKRWLRRIPGVGRRQVRLLRRNRGMTKVSKLPKRAVPGKAGVPFDASDITVPPSRDKQFKQFLVEFKKSVHDAFKLLPAASRRGVTGITVRRDLRLPDFGSVAAYYDPQKRSVFLSTAFTGSDELPIDAVLYHEVGHHIHLNGVFSKLKAGDKARLDWDAVSSHPDFKAMMQSKYPSYPETMRAGELFADMHSAAHVIRLAKTVTPEMANVLPEAIADYIVAHPKMVGMTKKQALLVRRKRKAAIKGFRPVASSFRFTSTSPRPTISFAKVKRDAVVVRRAERKAAMERAREIRRNEKARNAFRRKRERQRKKFEREFARKKRQEEAAADKEGLLLKFPNGNNYIVKSKWDNHPGALNTKATWRSDPSVAGMSDDDARRLRIMLLLWEPPQDEAGLKRSVAAMNKKIASTFKKVPAPRVASALGLNPPPKTLAPKAIEVSKSARAKRKKRAVKAKLFPGIALLRSQTKARVVLNLPDGGSALVSSIEEIDSAVRNVSIKNFTVSSWKQIVREETAFRFSDDDEKIKVKIPSAVRQINKRLMKMLKSKAQRLINRARKNKPSMKAALKIVSDEIAAQTLAETGAPPVRVPVKPNRRAARPENRPAAILQARRTHTLRLPDGRKIVMVNAEALMNDTIELGATHKNWARVIGKVLDEFSVNKGKQAATATGVPVAGFSLNDVMPVVNAKLEAKFGKPKRLKLKRTARAPKIPAALKTDIKIADRVIGKQGEFFRAPQGFIFIDERLPTHAAAQALALGKAKRTPGRQYIDELTRWSNETSQDQDGEMALRAWSKWGDGEVGAWLRTNVVTASADKGQSMGGTLGVGKTHLKALTAALDKELAATKLPHSLILWRGADYRILGLPDPEEVDFSDDSDDLNDGPQVKKARRKLVGKVFRDLSYTATTLRRLTADGFANDGKLLMSIRAPKGTPSHFMTARDSRFPGEREVLLPRTTKFRVISVFFDVGRTRWNVQMEIVP